MIKVSKIKHKPCKNQIQLRRESSDDQFTAVLADHPNWKWTCLKCQWLSLISQKNGVHKTKIKTKNLNFLFLIHVWRTWQIVRPHSSQTFSLVGPNLNLMKSHWLKLDTCCHCNCIVKMHDGTKIPRSLSCITEKNQELCLTYSFMMLWCDDGQNHKNCKHFFTKLEQSAVMSRHDS